MYTFIAKVDNYENDNYKILVNNTNIHDFYNDSNKTEKLIKSRQPLIVGMYIYAYRTEFNENTRELTVLDFTYVDKPKLKEVEPDPAVEELVRDSTKFLKDIPLKPIN